jgi:hypothetical protein
MENQERPRVPKDRQPTEDTPIGTAARVYRDNGQVHQGHIRSGVWMMCGTKVVQVSGIAGCYAVDCVEVQP